MRHLMLLVLLAGCLPPSETRPDGDWNITLSCDGGAEADALPACAEDITAILRLEVDDVSLGDHRTLFPGFERPDGAYTGVPGEAVWGFEDGRLVIELVADLDDPFLSRDDRAAWREHHLVLSGQYGSACFDADMTWVETATGTPVVTGEASLVRRGWECR